jgi:hypothetical protein
VSLVQTGVPKEVFLEKILNMPPKGRMIGHKQVLTTLKQIQDAVFRNGEKKLKQNTDQEFISLYIPAYIQPPAPVKVVCF